MTKNEWNHYYENVRADYRGLKRCYPFCFLTIPPTVNPAIASIRVVAANKELIDSTGAAEKDFTGEYSRELHIEVPTNYREIGCRVFGAQWVNLEKFNNKDIHFNNIAKVGSWGYELCVGVPESFPLMKNVILESVRTAENMLIAYERVMTGMSDKLTLIAYAHGEQGRKQFQSNKARYLPRRRTNEK